LATDSFGSISPRAAPVGPRSEIVRSGGFDPEPPASPSPTKAAPARVGTPVEVLFKPRPSYTDEARALKIEGEVVLEVEFSASGHVRVLRIVRGLGHGLDETAARAAEQIRFTPATNAGQAVDFTATVNILFRLT
jgi:TonB family protein